MRLSRLLSCCLGMFVLAVFVCSASFAQQPDRDRGRRDRNPEERMIENMKSELGLNDDQVVKLRDLMKENQEAARKASESRDAKIRELLDEGQAVKYDEMRKRAQERQAGRGGENEPEGRAPFGRIGRFGRQGEAQGADGDRGVPDILRNVLRNLELTDEQKEKIREITPELQQKVTEALSGLRGGMDPRGAMDRLSALRDQLVEKIKPLLTEEQLKKIDEISARGGRRAAEALQGGRAPGQGGPADPEQAIRFRLEAIKRELDTIPEVWAILSEKIEAVLKVEAEYRRQVREMSEKARELLKEATDEQVKEKMGEFRSLRKKMEEDLKARREDLRELLDLKEEAKLIIHGVLD